MNQNSKKKYYLSIALFVLLVAFGAAAVLISQRLFQTRDQAVAPNVADDSFAAVIQDPNDYCTIDLIVEPNTCGDACDTQSDCESGFTCHNNECRRETCVDVGIDGNCVCPTASPTPSATPIASPTPSNTPTPTPTNTPYPTVTPTPEPFTCVDLDKNIAAPQMGDVVSFACELSRQASVIYQFQYSVDEGPFVGFGDEMGNQANNTRDLKITEPGRYIVECRACIDTYGNGCTRWTAASN